MRVAFFSIAAFVSIPFAAALADSVPLVSGLKPVRQIAIQKPLLTDDDEVAVDVSGIACLPTASGSRTCVVINDEDRSARFATVADGNLIGGDKIILIGSQTAKTTFGKAPAGLQCSGGAASFKDLDGEAATYAAPFVYIVGSHGCSRKKAKFRASAFIVARVRLDPSGKVVNPDGSAPSAGSPAVETTYRLSEVLARGKFGQFFGKDLSEAAKGLNVEGAAVIGTTLYAGLRSPSLGGEAGIAVVSIEALFASGDAALSGAVPPMLSVPLGANLGIRDLAALSDGRLLLLSGPVQEQALPYGLFLIDPQAPSQPVHLATFEDVMEEGKRVKAEALLLFAQDADALRIILMFDGAPNGGPREYRVPLK
jgi:hypothetical protein